MSAIKRCQTPGHGRAGDRGNYYVANIAESLAAFQPWSHGSGGCCRLKRRLPVVSFSGAMNLMPVRARHVSRFARPASAATLMNRATT